MTVELPDLTSEKQIIQAAVEKTSKAYQEAPTLANLREWNGAKAALEKLLKGEDEDSAAERFKNIEQAAGWIIGQGYIVSPRTIRNHADRGAGFPRKQKDGSYLKSEISSYSLATWENPSQPKEQFASSDYTDDVKRETARKLRLENDIKEGRYLLRSEEEQRDAQLLFGLKTTVGNWGPFIIQDLLSLASAEIGEESSAKLGRITPELLARYRSQAAELFDTISQAGFLEVPDAD